MTSRRWSVRPNPGGWTNLYRGDQFIGRVRSRGDATRIADALNNAETHLDRTERTAIRDAIRASRSDSLLTDGANTASWDVADVMAAIDPFLRDDTP